MRTQMVPRRSAAGRWCCLVEKKQIRGRISAFAPL